MSGMVSELPTSEEGIKTLYQSYKEKQDVVDYIFAFCDAYLNNGRLDLAERLMRIVVEDNPTQIWPYLNLASVLSHAERRIEAIKIIAMLKKQLSEQEKTAMGGIARLCYSIASKFIKIEDYATSRLLVDFAAAIYPMGLEIRKAGAHPALSKEEFENLVNASLAKKNHSLSVFDAFKEVARNLDIKGRKVLCVMRETSYLTKNSRVCELLEFYQDTADEAGVNCRMFASNLLIHGHKYKIEDWKLELERLENVIIEFKPEVLYVDNFLNGRTEEIFELLKTFYSMLKQKYDVTICSFYADAWSDAQLPLIQKYADYYDLCHHTHPSHLDVMNDYQRSKQFIFPCPYPIKLYHHQDVVADLDLGFIGSFHEVRVPWVQALIDNKIETYFHFSNNQKTCDYATMDSYGRLLSRLKLSLVFSKRNTLGAPQNTDDAITGTIWETIMSNGVVLDDGSHEVTKYLTPFVHYIPFRNVPQLMAYSKYLLENEPLRKRIAQESFNFYNKNYSSKRFWELLFYKVDEVETNMNGGVK